MKPALLKSPHFISRLESLRGVAAMMVAVWHTLCVPPGTGFQAVIVTCLRRLTNGNAAVTLFFVLSGFVLGLGLRKTGEISGKGFLIFGLRRILRIYPVFAFSSVMVIGCLWYSQYAGLFPPWFNSPGSYRETELNPRGLPGAGVLLANLLLWAPTLNYVTWTLGIELRCSLLLPFLHGCSRRLSGRGKGLLLLALIFAACLGKWCLLLGSARAEAIVALFISAFAGFLFLFYLGYLLPEAGPLLIRKLQSAHPAASLLPWLAVVVLLWADSWGDEFRFLQGLGAALLIGTLLYGPETRFWRVLDHPLAKFYGRVSFSFYLWHDLVLVVTSRTLLHFVPTPAQTQYSLFWSAVLLPVSIIIATGLASLCYRFIERPCIDFGKKIASKLCTCEQ